MKTLYLLPLLPYTLALVAHPKRDVPDLAVRNKIWATGSWHHRTHTITVTTTTTLTVTFPETPSPTSNGTLLNATTPAETTTNLGLITLITLPSEVLSATSTSDDLAPITLIDLSTATPIDIPTTTDRGDAGVAPTPNDIAPIPLININTATPI
jgi:hypothetical protein